MRIRQILASTVAWLVAVLGGAGVAVVVAPGAAHAGTGTSVLLIHGFNPQGNGVDCAAYWGAQPATLRAAGLTGRIQTIGWYSNNTNCARNAYSTEYTRNFGGDVTAEGGTSANTLTKNTSLRHLAYRVAWAIAKEASENGGRDVQVIAHSTGGVIMRLVMQQASLGNPNFPTLAQMRVTAVHGYGVPHNGVYLAYLDGTTQGEELRPGSSVISGLQNTPRVGSAKWYSFTSTFIFTPGVGDGVVGESSACWDRSTLCYRYENPAYYHGDYMNDRELTVPRSGAFRSFTPVPGGGLNWGNLRDGVGAAGLTANRIVQQL